MKHKKQKRQIVSPAIPSPTIEDAKLGWQIFFDLADDVGGVVPMAGFSMHYDAESACLKEKSPRAFTFWIFHSVRQASDNPSDSYVVLLEIGGRPVMVFAGFKGLDSWDDLFPPGWAPQVRQGIRDAWRTHFDRGGCDICAAFAVPADSADLADPEEVGH